MTIVVPWPAGSSFDIVGRLIAEGIRQKYGNTVVVDNRTGASGNIGQAFVAKAKPDGYTFIITTPGPAANNALTFKSIPYDPLKDFSFISLTNRDPAVLVVRRNLPVNNFKEFIAYTKAKPGQVKMGAPGIGTQSHMTQLALQDLAGVEFNIVPYRGPPQVMQDLLGEQLDAGSALVGNFMPQIKAGQLKALVVFGDRRDAALPNVPTLIEEGYRFSSQPWTGMEGPRGLPRDIIVEMNKTLNEILVNKVYVEKFASLGMTAMPSTPEEFEKIVEEEVEKWRPVVKKYKVTAE
ncbi:Bug family tripartite tricarboxylate transporter substrate binding protein [Variovorax sp. SRS16]|uniref:Bug family tripartite tricarboxylate transporter substrate binding protein n=1 Tax=Variovorax sp. SRS16 TaxID=282217 RepID=UPI0013A59D33|nr:tripartite tricarboxylate transporter substrate binding protein [Variovorax sp. SRS16]